MTGSGAICRLPKTDILRERTIRTTTIMKTRLGSSSSQFLESIYTIDDFLEAIASERIRFMPHDGSKWDKVLRWAECFAGYIYILHEAVHGFMPHSETATRMIWSSVLSLLQMGPCHVNVLTKAFSVFHGLGLSTSLILRQQNLLTATAETRRELAYAYSDLMELTCAVSAHYMTKVQGNARIEIDDFADNFRGIIDTFYSHRDRICNSMWSTHVDGLFGGEPFEITEIRSFLEPADRRMRAVLTSRASLSNYRAEFTCEWFSSHLENFLRRKNKVLLITGAQGCGKTVLSDWIMESLQGSMDQTPYDAVYYRVERDIPYTTTSLSLVKSLALQIIDRNIGDEHLLLHTKRAMNMAVSGSPAAAVEQALWKALTHEARHTRTIIVIDGLDQLIGGQTSALAVLDQLHSVTTHSDKSGFKTIVLSRPLQKAAPSLTQHISIQGESVTEDIRHFVSAMLNDKSQFKTMSDKDKTSISHKVADKARGSFLWADFAFECLTHKQTLSGFLNYLDRAPKTVEAFFDHHVFDLKFDRVETRAILSWILAAERPLLLEEIKHLLEIDVKTCSISPRFGSIEDDVRRACGGIVSITDGFVSLKHSSMRHHLVTCKTDEFTFELKEAQRGLTIRCLAYVKIFLQEDVEATFRRMPISDAYSLFDRFELLEYCTLYWTTHFHSSSFHQGDGTIRMSDPLKRCFPNTAFLALLEGSCSYWHRTRMETEKFQVLAFDLRKMVLGVQSAACLQSLIFVVQSCQALGSTKLSEYSFDAWKMSKIIGHISIALACAEVFIHATASVAVTKRTTIVIQREEVLKFVIETQKHIHGASHESTIKYTKILAELYVSVREIDQAVILYRELYEITIQRYGHFHEETTTVYEILISQLTSLSRYDTVLELVITFHEYVVRTLAIHDTRRIKSTMTLIRMYEERKEIVKAEEVLVTYWRSITSSASSSTVIETKIDVAIEYSRFLCRHSRREEAEVIMRGVWSEVQIYKEEYRSETFVKRVKMIAEEFRSLKIFSMARSIFTYLWNSFQRTERLSSTIATEIATSLAETVTEMMNTTSTSESTTTTTEENTLTIEEEETLREVFESTLTASTSSSSSSTITTSTIKTSVALATSYSKQARWSKVVEIYSKTLSKVWSSVESVEIKASTIEHTEEVIDVAMSLAHSHFMMLHVEKAELIYQKIFRSLLFQKKCEQRFLVRTFRTIIEFYEKIYRFERAIEVYREFYVHLQKRFGKTHAFTIEIILAYGSLARRLGKDKRAEEAYYEIYISYRGEDGCCHADGLDAGFVLCELYEADCRWEAARQVYACLWRTFLTHGHEYKLDMQFSERVYEKYMHILEHKTKTEYTVIRQLAVEYRQTCIKHYGAHSEITVKSTMHLAQICERNEKYHEESMSLYEEVLKITEQSSKISKTSKSTTTTSTTLKTTSRSVTQIVRKRLAQMYSSKTSTVFKAVSLYQEQYENSISQYGYSSEESISIMKELVMVYRKQGTQESTLKATQILRTSVTEIFKRETCSERLIESAQAIARTYIECDFKETALTIIQELRKTVIEEVRTKKTTSTERTSYAFFAAFSEVIVATSSFSAIMAEIRSEIILYESYFRITRTQNQVLSIMERGSRLRIFLRECKRIQEAERIEAEMFEVFIKHVSSSVKRTTVHSFFMICLDLMITEHAEAAILERSIQMVLECTNSLRFQDAYDFALLVDRFVHLEGGFHSRQHVLAGFRLCLYLTGRRTKQCQDAKLYQAMLELSKTILRETLEASLVLSLSFTEMDPSELNEIAVLLGEQQNYEDLERILNDLWSSRIVQKTWSSTIVIWIGRRLIETRFTRGYYDDAIHLCKDIRYNLTRVWGSLDPTTMEFTNLLSELYTSRQQYSHAMALHEDILSHLAYDDDHELDQCETAPVKVALHQVEYLKNTYQRLGTWDRQAQAYKDLFAELSRRFEEDRAWMEKQPQIEKWPVKGASATWGCWKKPEDFGFVVRNIKAEKKKPSVLRRTSSSFAQVMMRQFSGQKVLVE
ncbi:hypothetical protein K490DRAFT_38494 [Saccharata proteae CBS 121410]|uniref:Uncharacterized protein n=1 Tax=Saccharata proteae CBS 121410 TaxID=1314787 RepID=A0A6A5YDY6_9PEZI|nr:hypothetical protein K490DRAFT_38494 [Saccharata proteae CBS 121410]